MYTYLDSFYPSSLFCRVAMTLGQRTRAITTPPSYSHCQMCNSLGKDLYSVTSDPFPSGGRQEGHALQEGWEGSHTTCGHWQKTWQCWVKQLYDWRQHTLHNHMGSLAFQAPWGWCRAAQVEATQQGICLTTEELPSVWWGSCAKAAKLWPEGNLIYYTGSRCYTDFLDELVWNKSYQGLYS